jgi:hypothetical protein
VHHIGAGLACVALLTSLALPPASSPAAPAIPGPAACTTDPACLVGTTASAMLASELLTIQQLFATIHITQQPTVLLYGDSFVTESAAVLQRGLARRGWQVFVKSFPGTGLCDWLPTMQLDSRLPVRLVVIAFSGNVLFTPCTTARSDGPDTPIVADFWKQRGARVVWASAPGRAGSTQPSLNTDGFRSVAARLGQRFVDAGAAVRAADGTYPLTLPCLPSEKAAQGCRNGMIAVRHSLDDGHLCPAVHKGLEPCPVYSSGIARWAGAILQAVRPLEHAP